MQHDNDSGYVHDLAVRQLETIKECQVFERKHRWHADHAFGLLTALKINGIELPRLPDKTARSLDADVLQLVVGSLSERLSHATSRTSSVRCFAWGYPLDREEMAPGVTCTTPVCTWAMLAPWLDLEELVILGWNILRRKPLHVPVTHHDFGDYLDRIQAASTGRRLPRGFAACRRALPLIHDGTDSGQEARFILLLMQYGLPLPERNLLMQAWDGSIYSLDAAYKKAKLALEYDGSFHSEQWQADAERRNRIEESGWVYIQVTKESLDGGERERRLMARIAELLSDRAHDAYAIRGPRTVESLSNPRCIRILERGHAKLRQSHASLAGEFQLSDEWLESA